MRYAKHLRAGVIVGMGALASAAAAGENQRTWPTHDGWYVSRSAPDPETPPSCTIFGGGTGKPDDASPERWVGFGLVFVGSGGYALIVDKADNLPQSRTMTLSVDDDPPFASRVTKPFPPATITEPEDASGVLRLVALIRSHERLVIAVNDQVYRLALHGFDAAAGDLDHCLETLPPH